jgi:hypothetical protein
MTRWSRRTPSEDKAARDSAVKDLRAAVQKAVVDIGRSVADLQAAQVKAEQLERKVRIQGGGSVNGK